MLEIWPPNYRKEEVGIPKLFSEAVKRGDVYSYGRLVEVSDSLRILMCEFQTYVLSGRESSPRVILMQERLRPIVEYRPGSNDVFWVTEGDVALNMIDLNWTGLLLAFASRGRVRSIDERETFALAMRGVIYEPSDQGFLYKEVHNPYPEEVLVADHLSSKNKQRILSSTTVVGENSVLIQGFSEERKLVEELEFPTTVDLRWEPVFQDRHDQALKDPNLPYQKWFDQLGAKIRCLNLNFPDPPLNENNT